MGDTTFSLVPIHLGPLHVTVPLSATLSSSHQASAPVLAAG